MSWEAAVRAEWERRHPRERTTPGAGRHPLVAEPLTADDALAAVEVLLTGRLSAGAQVAAFEEAFAARVGAGHAVMVNSGSSANLLAWATLTQPDRPDRLYPGDEVLIPAVCWSTSVWPLVQRGLVPVFVDVSLDTLNASPEALERAVTPRTRALMAVHVLGNATAPAQLLAFVERHGLLWVEDTCEALGSRYGGRSLGTLGDLGTFSFFVSHHLTTGEGGMVVCRSSDDADRLRALRAHGWSRGLPTGSGADIAPEVDPRFLFIREGFNLRPLEIQAAIGLAQLARLDERFAARGENHAALSAALAASSAQAPLPARAEQRPADEPPGGLTPILPSDGLTPEWFAFAALLPPGVDRGRYLDALEVRGIEGRPLVSGNFLRQPAFQRTSLPVVPSLSSLAAPNSAPNPAPNDAERAARGRARAEDFPTADELGRRGFYVGLHERRWPEGHAARLAEALVAALT